MADGTKKHKFLTPNELFDDWYIQTYIRDISPLPWLYRNTVLPYSYILYKMIIIFSYTLDSN